MRPAELRTTPVGYFTSRFGQPEYTDWLDESMSWKQTCSIGDWSFLWERTFKGRDAFKLLGDTSINSFANFSILQSKHVSHCDERGNLIAEGIVTRLSEDEFKIFSRGAFWLDYVRRRDGYDVDTEATNGFNFQIAGPRAVEVVEKAAGESLGKIKFMHSGKVEIAGHEVLALRQGMSGEQGFELQGRLEHAAEVYDVLWRTGAAYGMRRLGGRVAAINHLEACFPTVVTDYLPAIFSDDMQGFLAEIRAGLPPFATTFSIAGSFESEFVEAWYRNPVELGWGRNIKFDHDFIGREALEAEVAMPRRTIRTLVWNADDVVAVFASLFKRGSHYHFMEMPRDQRGFMYADKVMRDGREIGVATSRGYSYFFREMLSLSVIDVSEAEIGSDVTVIWGDPGEPQYEIRAKIAKAPYKTDNRRTG